GFPGLADLLRPVLVIRPGVQIAADGSVAATSALHARGPFGIEFGRTQGRTFSRAGQLITGRFNVRHNVTAITFQILSRRVWNGPVKSTGTASRDDAVAGFISFAWQLHAALGNKRAKKFTQPAH